METAGEIVMTSVAGPSQSVSPQSVQSGTQNNQNSSTSSTHHNQVIISNSFVQSTTPTQSIEINPAVVQSSNPGALNLYSSSQESFVQSSTTSTPQLILSPETFDQTQTVTSLPHTIVLPAEAYAQRITADRLLSQTAILAPESFVQSSTSAVAAQDTPETAVSVKVEPGEEPVLSSSETVENTQGNNIQAADSNSPKQSFLPCKVCGDRASGYHYGVTSCEGCKGFFRRSIQKQIEYRCLRDGKCLVIRLNRNRCQYCRFKKCLAVGMSRDSVRYGRVPKRAKCMDDNRVSSADSSQDQRDLESKQLAIYDIILNVSQAHHANCGITEDKLKTLERKHVTLMENLKNDLSSPFTDEEMECQRIAMWQNLAIQVTPSIQSVVEFAKRVPGFAELPQDDQLILIKSGYFEIWLARMARMCNKVENVITFEDGAMIQKDELAVVYTPDFVNAVFELATGFNQLSLNDTEVGLFTAIVLTTGDRHSLSDVKAVEIIQDKLIEALKLQVIRNHSTEEHLFAAIIMKLPELRTLGSQHTELLNWYRYHWQKLRLPPLFAEIYDIPKNDEETSA